MAGVFKISKNKLIKTAVLLAAVLVLVLAGIGIYAARVLYIKNAGIALKARNDYAAADIVYYLQNDPKWAEDDIGHSSNKMGHAGCLVTCVAAAATNLGSEITPGDLNKRLTQVGGYAGADLIWYKINEAVPDVDYRYKRLFSSADIERDLAAGLLPIINVHYKKTGVTHWLLVVGAENGEFLVFDPLVQEKKPIKLSVHGKAYAYRVLEKENETDG